MTNLFFKAVILRDIIVINGQKFWMPMLLNFSKKKEFLMLKLPKNSKKMYFQKAELNIQ